MRYQWMMGALITRAAQSLARAGFGFSPKLTKYVIIPPSHPLQTLLDTLTSIQDIQSAVYSPYESPEIMKIMDIMNGITLKDLGINEKDVMRGMEVNQCMSIVMTKDFNVAVFLIPFGKSLPLHDHPSMTVLSKVIRGNMRIRGFSKMAAVTDQSGDEDVLPQPVSLSLDSEKSEKDPAWLLTPTEGNIHEFTAISTCVVFDVLMPPYDMPDRPCNYFTVAKDGDKWWLSPAPEPSSGLPYGVEYQGFRPIIRNLR